MSTKVLEFAEMKATLTETDQHMIEFYALTFRDSPDKQGDRIDPGAVDDWLDEFYKGGFPLPISFTHAAVRDSTNPFAIVGYAPSDAEHVFKDDKGLVVRAYLDTGANETAKQVYTLAKRGIINRASVAYIAEKESRDPFHKGATLIQRMRIMEAGPCLDPADDQASMLSVKDDMENPDRTAHAEEEVTVPEAVSVTIPVRDYEELRSKAGRRISAATSQTIRAALEALASLLEDVETEEDQGKANGEEPETANPEELGPNGDLRVRLAAFEPQE